MGIDSAPVPRDGALTLRQDGEVIRVRGRGFWTPAQAAAHFQALAALIAARRALAAPVRVLVDLREAQVQSAAIAEGIRASTQRLYRAGDRAAIVVASGLLRVQVRRIVEPTVHELFVAEADALAWLRG